MSSRRSTQILGIADALAHLAAQAQAAPPACCAGRDPEALFSTALDLVTAIEERRRGRFPTLLTVLEPLPLCRKLMWPPAGGLQLTVTGFERQTRLRVVHAAPPFAAGDAQGMPDLRPRRPRGIAGATMLDAVEFAGPPPRLPIFSVEPMRYRYYADPVLLCAPRLIPVEISMPVPQEPPSREEAPAPRFGSMLASVAAILRTRGK